ncbi:MAG: glutathione peroxidase [Pyrinomonadaceae bacterium]|nr:glutathione peroxidase [Pyrinomonadaceae bacterium]
MFAAAVLIAGYVFYDVSTSSGFNKRSVHEFTAMDIDGKDVSLKSYSGDILLIVNTASQCGYTPQYEGLQKIYDRFKDKNFKVIGFPTNNFGGQEPGSNEEIKDFCTTKYKVTFPMFAKISVKGEDQHPLYKFLTDKEQNGEFGGDITWNFNKFLANEKGEIVARFTSKDTPESETVVNAIEKYIAERDAAKDKAK